MIKSLLLLALTSAVSYAQANPSPTPTQTPATATSAQQPIAATNVVQKADAPTDSDLYCSGFITSSPVPHSITVVGGLNSPAQTRFAGHDFIYLTGGEFKPGDRFSILRHVRDPNVYEIYRGKTKTIRSLGEIYAELGVLKIVNVKGTVGVGQVDLSCSEFTLGDIAVPFVERPRPAFRRNVVLDPLASPNGKVTGRIVLAREFDSVLGSRRIVYLNVGADQGIKSGDYFRATRTYESLAREDAEALSFKAITGEPQQKPTKGNKEPYQQIKLTGPDSSGMVKGFPRKTLGDLMVLNVLPHTSTALIVDALDPIQAGDRVEMMEEPAPEAAAAPAAAPPTVSCTANPASGPVGASFTISCTGNSPDERPLTYAFETTKGHLMPRDSVATLTTRDVEPGPISIKTMVTDDRNLSASTLTSVTIEAPPTAPPAPPAAPTPSLVNSFFFKPNSARVDNAAKAILDEVALQLQRDSSTTVALIGDTNPEENPDLGGRRATNAKNYLVKEKGIDANRIQVKAGATTGTKAEIWMIPAGASLPQ